MYVLADPVPADDLATEEGDDHVNSKIAVYMPAELCNRRIHLKHTVVIGH